MRARLRGLVAAAALLPSACLEATPVEDDEGGSPQTFGTGDEPLASATRASLVTWNLQTYPLTQSTDDIFVELAEAWGDDVIAVQEIVDVDRFGEAVARLPSHSLVVNDDQDGWLRLGLVYDTRRVEVTDIETLFRGDSYAFPRPPLRVDLTIFLEDRDPLTLVVVVVHFKSQVGDGTAARRRAAAERLHEWIGEHVAAGGDPDVVVLGDFNEELTEQPSASDFETFLARPEEYAFLTYDANIEGGFTQLSFESFLDHVLVTTDALGEYGDGETVVLEPRRTHGAYESLVSDHLPVRAVFAPPVDGPLRD